jgi:uncharacterized membrane protein
MKALRTPIVVLTILYLCLLGSLVLSGPRLPERVATHFDGSGRPNGWMSRSSHLRFTAILGFGLPLAVVAICYVLRYLPASMLNIPRREHWLAPEQQAESYAYLFRHSLWFACLATSFISAIHLLIMQANTRASPRLSTAGIVALAACFVAGVILWSIVLIRHFGRTPKPAARPSPGPSPGAAMHD